MRRNEQSSVFKTEQLNVSFKNKHQIHFKTLKTPKRLLYMSKETSVTRRGNLEGQQKESICDQLKTRNFVSFDVVIQVIIVLHIQYYYIIYPIRLYYISKYYISNHQWKMR